MTFVNKHLNKVNLEVNDLDTQFHDGVYLTLLMGLLEGFFVPLYSFHLTPQDFDQKVHNVTFAFELMQDVGLAKPKARPEGKIFCLFAIPKEVWYGPNIASVYCSSFISLWKIIFEFINLRMEKKMLGNLRIIICFELMTS